jgi:TadE-like protein
MRMSFLNKLLPKWRPGPFLSDDRGVTVIEFAFLGPILGAAILVTIETGIILYVEYAMQTSIQEASRLVRTGRAQGHAWNAEKFKNAVCSLAGRVIDCQGKVTVYMQAAENFKTLQAATPSYITISGKNYAPAGLGTEESPFKPQAPYDCGGPSEAVALIATYDWRAITPMMTAFSNLPDERTRRIVAFALFRNEAYPAAATAVCPVLSPPTVP